MRHCATFQAWSRLAVGSVAIAALALVVLNPAAARATDTAADNFGKTTKSADPPTTARERALAQFDTNGDGKLSEAERRAARTSLQKRRKLDQQAEQQASMSPTRGGMGQTNSMTNASTNPYVSSNPYATNSLTNPYANTGMSGGGYYYYGAGTFGQGMGSGGCSGGSMGGSGMSTASMGGMGMGGMGMGMGHR